MVVLTTQPDGDDPGISMSVCLWVPQNNTKAQNSLLNREHCKSDLGGPDTLLPVNDPGMPGGVDA